MELYNSAKHVRLVINLEIGEIVEIRDWGYKFDGKKLKIEDIKKSDNCSSGALVKVDGHENYIDSDWITKLSN